MKSVDVVVVSYNSAPFLPRLAESLRDSVDIASVTIVDNDSRDESILVAQRLDWGAPVRVKATGWNAGFGAAINYGVFTNPFKAEKVLIINPDVTIDAAVLAEMSEELESDPDRAALGTRLTTTQGRPVSSARDFPSLRAIARRVVHEVQHEGRLVEADWLCGALMLWRREAFEAVGGFSPEYFLYFEDVDICKKARTAGWTIAIDGRHRAVHDEGHGMKTSPALRRVSRKSRRIYSRKWHGSPGIVAAAVADATDAAATIYHLIRRK